MIFKKKPETVEAEEYRVGCPLPLGVVMVDGSARIPVGEHGRHYFVRDGDFVIQGPTGPYPVNAKEFWARYEVMG